MLFQVPVSLYTVTCQWIHDTSADSLRFLHSSFIKIPRLQYDLGPEISRKERFRKSPTNKRFADLPKNSLSFDGEPPCNIHWVPLQALVVVALASTLQVAQLAVHLEGRKLMKLLRILHSKGRPQALGEFLGVFVTYCHLLMSLCSSVASRWCFSQWRVLGMCCPKFHSVSLWSMRLLCFMQGVDVGLVQNIPVWKWEESKETNKNTNIPNIPQQSNELQYQIFPRTKPRKHWTSIWFHLKFINFTKKLSVTKHNQHLEEAHLGSMILAGKNQGKQQPNGKTMDFRAKCVAISRGTMWERDVLNLFQNFQAKPNDVFWLEQKIWPWFPVFGGSHFLARGCFRVRWRKTSEAFQDPALSLKHPYVIPIPSCSFCFHADWLCLPHRRIEIHLSDAPAFGASEVVSQ